MKKLLSILVLLNFVAMLVLPDILQATTIRFKIYNLAVLNIKPKGDLNADDALLLTSELERRLGEINFIQTLSMQAQQYQGPDYCTSLRCALQKGRQIGADFIVYGIIEQIGDYFSCDFRMADVAAKKLVGSAAYKFDGGLDVVLDQMKNIGRKLVGLRTSLDMPLSRRSLAEAKKAKQRKKRKSTPVSVAKAPDLKAKKATNGKQNIDSLTWDSGTYEGVYSENASQSARMSDKIAPPKKNTVGERPVKKKKFTTPSQSDEYLDSITWDVAEETGNAMENETAAPTTLPDPIPEEKIIPAEPVLIIAAKDAVGENQNELAAVKMEEESGADDDYFKDDFAADWSGENNADAVEPEKNAAALADKKPSISPQQTVLKLPSAKVGTLDTVDYSMNADDFDGVDFLDSLQTIATVPAIISSAMNTAPEEMVSSDAVDEMIAIDTPEKNQATTLKDETGFLSSEMNLTENKNTAPVQTTTQAALKGEESAPAAESPASSPAPVKLIEIAWDDSAANPEKGFRFDDYNMTGDAAYSPITDDETQESFLGEDIWADYKVIKPVTTLQPSTVERVTPRKDNVPNTEFSSDESIADPLQTGAEKSHKNKSSADSITEIFPAYSMAGQNHQTLTEENSPASQAEIVNDDDGFPQAEFLTNSPEKEKSKAASEKPARQYKVGKWGLYGLLATGVGTGIIIAAKNLGKPGNPGDNGSPLPKPPEFLGGN